MKESVSNLEFRSTYHGFFHDLNWCPDLSSLDWILILTRYAWLAGSSAGFSAGCRLAETAALPAQSLGQPSAPAASVLPRL